MRDSQGSLPTRKLADPFVTPRVIMGCWQLAAGHSSIQLKKPLEHLDAFFSAGFTTFDCADIYTGVEELLGQFRNQLAARSTQVADRLRVHTKFVPDRDSLPTIGRREVETIIERSLRRLNVDCLDLVQFHWWDTSVARYVETALILADLKTVGKIGQIGLTNFDAGQTAEIVSAGVPVISNQVQYSVIDRRPELKLIHCAEQNDFSLFCYGTVAGGFLSERYLGVDDPQAALSNRSLVKYQLVIEEAGGWDRLQNALKFLQRIARKHDVSIANVASKFVLDQPQVAAVIVGARNVEHLPDLRKLFSYEFDEQDRQDIRDALRQFDPLSPGVYHLERNIGGRHAAIMKYNLNSES